MFEYAQHIPNIVFVGEQETELTERTYEANGKDTCGIRTESATSLFTHCSLLMASLFALSALFQLDDPDWYFWLPLYATASVINLVSGVLGYRIEKQISFKLTIWFGLFLFFKVVIEDFMNTNVGFLSLDMRESVVREKLGSVLVIVCVFLQLKATQSTHTGKLYKVEAHVQYGMAGITGIGYGLSLVCFLFPWGEMKFK